MAVKGGIKFGGKKNFGNVTLPGAAAVKEANDNPYGAAVFSKLSDKQIESVRQDIPLSKIRLNPDNAIFNEADTSEDIDILADDIKRNGLMHNIVVFPEQEDGNTVYMLLSGERRYKALCKLAKEDAQWNTVKGCNIITSKLSDNEKKVLLYSANLQVRGGFGDEKIRRKAVTAFIDCLQKEPYNLSEVEAKKAIKEISPENTKALEKDVRLERSLCDQLKEMLDTKLLNRSEAEIYQRFENDKQLQVADKLNQLFKFDCHGDGGEDRNSVEVRRDNLHISFREALFAASKAGTYDVLDKLFAKALADFDAGFEVLSTKVDEYVAAKEVNTEKQMADLEYANINDAAKDKAKKKKEADAANKEKQTVVQKKVPQMKKQLDAIIHRKNYVNSFKQYSEETLNADIESLDEVIEAATTLKQMIENAQRDNK